MQKNGYSTAEEDQLQSMSISSMPFSIYDLFFAERVPTKRSTNYLEKESD